MPWTQPETIGQDGDGPLYRGGKTRKWRKPRFDTTLANCEGKTKEEWEAEQADDPNTNLINK